MCIRDRYTGPYVITKNNNNNTYEIMNPITKKIKGTYNQESIKKYHDETPSPIINE